MLGRRVTRQSFVAGLDLLEEGRSVAQVAHNLDISEQSIYMWRRPDRIDKGLVPGLTSKEKSELTTAKTNRRA